MEAIYLIQRLIELYRDRKKDLHTVFLDLEKAYHSVPREALWRCTEKKGIHVDYLGVINDIYEGVRTRVRT